MKFHTMQSPPQISGTTFDSKVQRYRLDVLNKKLVKDHLEDTSELVQSSADCALKRVLERFGVLPDDYLNGGRVVIRDEDGNVVDDMVELGKSFEKAETYRDKLGLDVDASLADIYQQVQKVADTLKAKTISNITDRVDKGGETVEKETQQKSE